MKSGVLVSAHCINAVTIPKTNPDSNTNPDPNHNPYRALTTCGANSEKPGKVNGDASTDVDFDKLRCILSFGGLLFYAPHC